LKDDDDDDDLYELLFNTYNYMYIRLIFYVYL